MRLATEVREVVVAVVILHLVDLEGEDGQLGMSIDEIETW